MGEVVSGTVHAFFLYDVADAIDLAEVQRLVGATVQARLAPRPATPPYVQYQQPPVAIDGQSVDTPGHDGFQVRFKVFDYGVISVALTRHLPPTWEQLLEQGLGWYENPGLSAAAERCVRTLLRRLEPAVARPRPDFLAEDYLVFAVTPSATAQTSAALLAAHGAELAQLLRGERARLSAEEREEVLRHHLSYLEHDLVIPTWNAAFIYDEESGAQGTLEILEFANSQLLEFRYYDQRLDAELSRIYAQLQGAGWRTWFGRRYARAARQVHALFIDVNELTDKTENALKIAGDVYAARLFALAAARLALDHWKASVREKLTTVDDIYRFAVEHTAMARGEFLELTIVFLIVLEIVLALTGSG